MSKAEDNSEQMSHMTLGILEVLIHTVEDDELCILLYQLGKLTEASLAS